MLLTRFVRSLGARGALLALTILLVGTASVRAQEGDDRTAPRGPLTLSYVDAYIEGEAEYGYQKVRTERTSSLPRGRTQRNRQWIFEERLGLSFGGSMFEPGKFDFGGSVSFGLTQTRFKEEIDGFDSLDDRSAPLFEYDLRADFLRGEDLSGSIFARRFTGRINRRFQPTLNERRTEWGTSWALSDEKLPLDFSYDYREYDRTGNGDPLDDEHYTEETFRARGEWLDTDARKLTFSYEHGITRQEYQGLDQRFDTDRDLLIAEYVQSFGSERQHEFRTLLHWQEESGDFARDLFEIGPQLRLRHSDALETSYQYQFNRERYAGLDIELHRADFELVHRLYTNLTTTVNVFGLYEDIENDINTTQYGASIDWQYNRKNDFGHLYANLALAYDTENVDGDDGIRVILDEAQVLRDPSAAILRNRNVIPASIVVTDTSNRRLFTPGIDYVVTRRTNVTLISRITTGRIADGETILVDYQYRTPQDGQLDTIRADFNIEQRFTGGLKPYYRLAYRNQEDDDSFGFARRADRTNHHRVGLEYLQDRYSLSGEYEIFDDSVDPYTAFHVTGDWQIIRTTDEQLAASSRLSRFFFDGEFDNRNVTIVDVSLDHRNRLTEDLSLMERVAYRYQDDSVAGITRGWDVAAGIEYVVGDFTGEMTIEYDQLDVPGSEDRGFGFWVRMRREFRNVLAQ